MGNDGINIARPGLPVEEEKITLINRTGGTLRRGGLVALNLDFAATSGQAMVGLDPAVNADGATGYVFNAAITPTATNGCTIVAWAAGTIADNAEGEFVICGLMDVGVESGVAKGDFLTPYTAAAASAVGTNATRTNEGTLTGYTRAELDAFQLPVPVLGIALEDSSAEQTVKAYVNGYAFRSLIGGGA